MANVFPWLKKPVLLLTLLALASGVFGFWLSRSVNRSPETIAVFRGAIREEVIVTGKTKSSEHVELAFERAGKIREVRARVGDRVKAGDLLVVLEASDLAAELRGAEAAADAERALLSEGIALQEAKVSKASSALAEARQNLVDKLRDAYTKADDAIRVRADQFFSNPRSQNPQIIGLINDQGLETEIEFERLHVESILQTWPGALGSLGSTTDLDAPTAQARGDLGELAVFLERVALALSLLPTSTTVDDWRSDTATGRTNVNTASANLSAAGEKHASAEADLAIAERELELKRGQGLPGGVSTQAAALDKAEANVQAIRAELAKTVIRSPLAGIVTRQDAKIGEIATASARLVAVLSERRYEIEANVPEVDIGNIRLQNPVAITLDAFPGEALGGRVVAIDPAETIVDGVVNFKITVTVEEPEERLKSGLTANLAIETRKKERVLLLPQVAILETDAGTFVRKLEPSSTREVAVTIGIRGEDGMVEIVSGLGEGDRVLNIGNK